ncbi:MAG: surface-adhesin E family protein [Smithellaceae bacterium]
MKHFYSLIFLPFLAVFLLAGCVTTSSVPAASTNATSVESPAVKAKIPDSSEWELLGKTRTGEVYYKKAKIVDSSNLMLVTTYKIVADDHRKEMIEKMMKNDVNLAKKYQNYEYNIRQDEIDCKNRMFRMIESIDYDNQGQVLIIRTAENKDWHKVPILTGVDKLCQKLCVAEKKPADQKKPSSKKKPSKKKK